MFVFKKAAAGTALALALVASGLAQPANRAQAHSSYSSHYTAAKVQSDKIQVDKVQSYKVQSYKIEDSGKNLPRSTVTPGPTSSATAGSVRTHVSEVDRLERQSSVHLAAEAKRGVKPAISSSHIAHAETSSRGSSINFSYHSPQRVQTGRAAAASNRKP